MADQCMPAPKGPEIRKNDFIDSVRRYFNGVGVSSLEEELLPVVAGGVYDAALKQPNENPFKKALLYRAEIEASKHEPEDPLYVAITRAAESFMRGYK